MVLFVLVGSLFLALITFALGNVAGAAVFKARGPGLISLASSVPPERWRAPAARLAGPLAVYLLASALHVSWFRSPESATNRIILMRGEAAEVAGLQDGDQVVEMNGAPVTSFGQVEAGLDAAGPGQTVALVVMRDQERITVRPTLNAESRLGVNPYGEFVVHSWAEGVRMALLYPSAGVLIPARALYRRWSGAKEPPPLKSSKLPVIAPTSQAAIFVTFLWPLLFLLMIGFQFVAWARGELRAPTPGRG
ncbi:MAG TPA: PDZ domain-containing protein [Myxococcaceae bacterium]|jgi:hypothetical protein